MKLGTGLHAYWDSETCGMLETTIYFEAYILWIKIHTYTKIIKN